MGITTEIVFRCVLLLGTITLDTRTHTHTNTHTHTHTHTLRKHDNVNRNNQTATFAVVAPISRSPELPPRNGIPDEPCKHRIQDGRRTRAAQVVLFEDLFVVHVYRVYDCYFIACFLVCLYVCLLACMLACSLACLMFACLLGGLRACLFAFALLLLSIIGTVTGLPTSKEEGHHRPTPQASAARRRR